MGEDEQSTSQLREAVKSALREVQDPCAVALRTDWSLVDLGLLVDIRVDDNGALVVELALTDPLCPFFERIEEMVVGAVAARTGYQDVTVDISGDVAWDPSRLQKSSGRTARPVSIGRTRASS